MNGSKLACLVAAIALATLALAGDAKNASYAVIEGTVFHEPGFALPDAKVVLQARDDPKAKKQQAVTNYRGEFVFHVPATQAVYVLTASMKGFRPEQKEAAIQGGAAPGQERVDVNLVLQQESK